MNTAWPCSHVCMARAPLSSLFTPPRRAGGMEVGGRRRLFFVHSCVWRPLNSLVCVAPPLFTHVCGAVTRAPFVHTCVWRCVAPLCSNMCAPQHDHAASAMGDRVFITAHTDAEVSTFYDADYRSRVKDLLILALPLSEGLPPCQSKHLRHPPPHCPRHCSRVEV